MFPYFTLFGRDVPMFSVMSILGIVVAALLASRRAPRYGLQRSETAYYAAFAGIGLVAGATLLFAIVHTPHVWANRQVFWEDPLGFLGHWFGGMIFYGGLFGAVGAILGYAKYAGHKGTQALALLTPFLPLAHAFMRVGCFMAGCCYGMEAMPPWGMLFPRSLGAPQNVYILPIQLYESAANLVIFTGLFLYTRKENKDGVRVAAFYGLAYSTARFVLEFFRGDIARGFAGALSTSQWISIGVFLLSVVGLLVRKRAVKPIVPNED